MERRKRSITCISLSPSNITFTHTLSFTLMAKLTRRRRKHKITTTPRNKVITTLNTLDIFLKNPQGSIYRHQGKGGQGDNLWPKTLVRPRQYYRGNAVRAAFLRLY